MLQDTSLQRTNYILISDIFKPDELDTHKLLDFVAAGNNVFVAAHRFAGLMADSIRIETDIHLLGDSTVVNFVNPTIRREKDYVYERGAGS